MNDRTVLFVLIGLAVAVALAAFISPFASKSPDGLDKFAEEQNIEETPRDESPSRNAPMPDYSVEGAKNEWLSTAIAGAVGTLVVFIVMWLLAKIIARKKRVERRTP
jgi:cobalt/nickel transport protein